MKSWKRLTAVCLTAGIITGIFTGCGMKQANVKEEFTEQKGVISYPIETNAEITYWVPLNATVSANAATLNDTPFAKRLIEETGINVKFIHPTQGQEAESFNLLLASGNTTDIICWSWYSYPGGPDKAINDGMITRLNDLMPDYTPYMSKVLSENPELDKMVRTDSGTYYNFPVLKPDDKLTVFLGPIIRKDWLDDLGLEVPETIDEWHSVLTAFKEKKGADAPLSFAGTNIIKTYGAFVGAFGTIANFYIDNGKIKYGPLDDPGFKDFLMTFNQWYSEGLLDRNISTIDGKILDTKILNGNTGATVGFNSSGLGKWLTAKEGDPEFNLTAARYPSLAKGEMSEFGQKDLPYSISSTNAAISAKSKNKAVAARFLDYAYGEEGHMLYNFGTEGETYEMVDGEPVFTDLIMDNPEGLSIANALGQYTHSSYEGAFVSDVRYFNQYLPFEQQQEALELWPQTNMAKHLIPRITPTSEESDEMSKIETELYTYIDEMMLKFIMGTEPFSNYEQFLQTRRDMGVERCKEIKQTALERYENR